MEHTAASKCFAETYTPEKGYHTASRCYYGRVAETFGRNLPRIKQARILDFGCSIGWTTIELANLYPDSSVIGIDIRRYSILDALQNRDRTKKEGIVAEFRDILVGNHLVYRPCLKTPDHFFIADGFHAPFKAETFEAVFCMNNIYYIVSHAEKQLATERLNQIARLVKPGGFLLISGCSTDLENDYIILKKRAQGFVQHKISVIKYPQSKRCLEIILNSLLRKN